MSKENHITRFQLNSIDQLTETTDKRSPFVVGFLGARRMAAHMWVTIVRMLCEGDASARCDVTYRAPETTSNARAA